MTEESLRLVRGNKVYISLDEVKKTIDEWANKYCDEMQEEVKELKARIEGEK